MGLGQEDTQALTLGGASARVVRRIKELRDFFVSEGAQPGGSAEQHAVGIQAYEPEAQLPSRLGSCGSDCGAEQAEADDHGAKPDEQAEERQ